jgi:hypothetical protein
VAVTPAVRGVRPRPLGVRRVATGGQPPGRGPTDDALLTTPVTIVSAIRAAAVAWIIYIGHDDFRDGIELWALALTVRVGDELRPHRAVRLRPPGIACPEPIHRMTSPRPLLGGPFRCETAA